MQHNFNATYEAIRRDARNAILSFASLIFMIALAAAFAAVAQPKPATQWWHVVLIMKPVTAQDGTVYDDPHVTGNGNFDTQDECQASKRTHPAGQVRYNGDVIVLSECFVGRRPPTGTVLQHPDPKNKGSL